MVRSSPARLAQSRTRVPEPFDELELHRRRHAHFEVNRSLADGDRLEEGAPPRRPLQGPSDRRPPGPVSERQASSNRLSRTPLIDDGKNPNPPPAPQNGLIVVHRILPDALRHGGSDGCPALA